MGSFLVRLSEKTVTSIFLSTFLTIILATPPAQAAESASTTKFSSLKSNRQTVAALKTEAVASPSKGALRLMDIKRNRIKKGRKYSSSKVGYGIGPDTMVTPEISGEVTLVKSALFNRDFLYGSDLQYSSIGESDGMLLQSLALGHSIARFRLIGDRLQLIADQRHLFESNINHPDRLIHEFRVTHHDLNTITISIREASVALKNIFGSDLTIRHSWIRSIKYIDQGSFLMFESSVELSDGTVAEFMESVFPRDALVPQNATPLLNDPGINPLAERYRFLSDQSLFLDLPGGRKRTAVANRFHVIPGQVIVWYVTPNIPTEYLPVVKSAVEGWNRYSQKMWGRNLVSFEGILPPDIKIGDPRFNVINWDSVPDASAAYESQASDPLTGIQSHSLIYLPFAWIKIGVEFWQMAESSQTIDSATVLASLKNKGSFLGRKLNVRCLQDVEMMASLDSRRSPETFAKELLKGVLFHEVGHALGLNHNFKGSLSFNVDEPHSPFSTSIMDYNQYHIEDGAFDSVHASHGPLLEYDRQILSVLYNSGADVKETDPVLPACSDEESDDQFGGVDPLCVRYDAGRDPTMQLLKTVNLIKEPQAKMGKTQSLYQAIHTATQALGDPSTVTTEQEIDERLFAMASAVVGTTKYYLMNGAQSVNALLRANLRSLYVYKPETLPNGYSEKEMRTRVLNSLVYIANLHALEDATQEAYWNVLRESETWLLQTPWYNKLSDADKPAYMQNTLQALFPVASYAQGALLPKLRATVLQSLVRFETLPFYFGGSGGNSTDFERMTLELLEAAVAQPLGGVARTPVERFAAATSLMSFKDLPEGIAAIERLKSRIDTELRTARNANERETVRGLLGILKQAD